MPREHMKSKALITARLSEEFWRAQLEMKNAS